MDILTSRRALTPARGLAAMEAEWSIALRFGVAALAGAAWGGPDRMLAVVPFVFAAFWHARVRLEAFLVVWVYHLVSARSLVVGGTRFFDVPIALSALLVGVCAAVVAAAWAVCWLARDAKGSVPMHAARTSMLLGLTALPPLTAFAVPHPISAAGIWFPATGYVGLALMALAAGAMRSIRWGLVPCTLVALVSLVRGPATPREPPLELAAVQTHVVARRTDLGDFARQWWIAQDAMKAITESRAQLVVLPEGIGGLWSAPMREQWAETDRALRVRGQTALIGVTEGSAVEPLSAAVVALGATSSTYHQRVAIPVAMWRPGLSSSFTPKWLAPGTLDMAFPARTVRVGVLVCWEIGVVWCVLRTMAEGADVLVTVANAGWLAGTTAARAQAQMLQAWAALFNIPAALAANT